MRKIVVSSDRYNPKSDRQRTDERLEKGSRRPISASLAEIAKQHAGGARRKIDLVDAGSQANANRAVVIIRLSRKRTAGLRVGNRGGEPTVQVARPSLGDTLVSRGKRLISV